MTKWEDLATVSDAETDADRFLLCLSLNLRCWWIEGARNDDTGAYQGLNTARDGWYRGESLDAPPQGCCCDKDQKSRTTQGKGSCGLFQILCLGIKW